MAEAYLICLCSVCITHSSFNFGRKWKQFHSATHFIHDPMQLIEIICLLKFSNLCDVSKSSNRSNQHFKLVKFVESVLINKNNVEYNPLFPNFTLQNNKKMAIIVKYMPKYCLKSSISYIMPLFLFKQTKNWYKFWNISCINQINYPINTLLLTTIAIKWVNRCWNDFKSNENEWMWPLK